MYFFIYIGWETMLDCSISRLEYEKREYLATFGFHK